MLLTTEVLNPWKEAAMSSILTHQIHIGHLAIFLTSLRLPIVCSAKYIMSAKNKEMPPELKCTIVQPMLNDCEMIYN